MSFRKELDIHYFDNKNLALGYLFIQNFKYDRHEPWAFTSGVDFYQNFAENTRASLREKNNSWQVCIWRI